MKKILSTKKGILILTLCAMLFALCVNLLAGTTTNFGWNYGTKGQSPWWEIWTGIFQAIDTEVYALKLKLLGYQDARAYASINAAVTAIGATQTTLNVSNSQTLTGNLVIPSTLNVMVLKGGTIVLGDYNLTFNGTFHAGLYAVFDYTGTGVVSFGSGSIKEVYPQWWGAKGDGVTDDTVAIQAAIDSCISLYKGINNLVFPPNHTWLIGSTLNITEVEGFLLNANNSKFKWNGNTTTPMFLLTDVKDSEIRNMVFPAHTKYLENIFHVTKGTTLNVIPTNIHWENIFINGGFAVNKCWKFSGATSVDLHSFFFCQARYYQTAGWSFEGPYSIGHSFFGCSFAGGGTGLYGVTTNLGTANQGGAFNWYGGTGGGNVSADFDLGEPNIPMIIQGFESEGSNRFLQQVTSPSGGNQHMNLIGNVYVGDSLNADDEAIILNNGGVYNIIGNYISGPNAANIAKIHCHTNYKAVLNINGNFFMTVDSDTVNPITVAGSGEKAIHMKGNIYKNAVGAPSLREIPTLVDDATPSILGEDKWLTGGTTTITDFDDGYTGQIITIISEHAITITDGTNIFLNGSANFVMGATDTLTLIQKADGKWYEISRSVN